jgi:hypothetical protein
MTVFVVPSSAGGATTLLQFDEAIPLVFCCKVKSVEGEGQATAAVFVVVWVMVSSGAPALEYLTVTQS